MGRLDRHLVNRQQVSSFPSSFSLILDRGHSPIICNLYPPSTWVLLPFIFIPLGLITRILCLWWEEFGLLQLEVLFTFSSKNSSQLNQNSIFGVKLHFHLAPLLPDMFCMIFKSRQMLTSRILVVIKDSRRKSSNSFNVWKMKKKITSGNPKQIGFNWVIQKLLNSILFVGKERTVALSKVCK